MKLYFQHSDGEFEYVQDVMDHKEAVHIADKDVHKRNPKFEIYYIRTWTDDDGLYWMDVGSHTEFYVVKDE